jgi:hypothetical protein
MEFINPKKPKGDSSQFLERAASGEEIIVAKAERPLGLFRGQAQMRDDFDAPLPDALAEAFWGAIKSGSLTNRDIWR